MKIDLLSVPLLWRSAAGKLTVGLASHRPCVTDVVVYTYGLNGIGKGDEHPPMFQEGQDAVFTIANVCRHSYGRILLFNFDENLYRGHGPEK